MSSQSVKAQSSDLAILSAAARQLFESTVTMSTDSVVSILAALATVSQKSMPQAVQQPGHPRQGPPRGRRTAQPCTQIQLVCRSPCHVCCWQLPEAPLLLGVCAPCRGLPALSSPPWHSLDLSDQRLSRLYPLARMVEVLLYNLPRIHNLWPIFLTHVCDILGDARPAIRAAATDALGRAVGGALAHVTARYAPHLLVCWQVPQSCPALRGPVNKVRTLD